MAKQELYDKSPIRAFDKATNGGLKAGEIGLVTAKKGMGKTSVLVQFGMDTLLNGSHMIHVSFDQQSANIITWYDGIFTEIAKKINSNSDELKADVMRSRTILNFNQENFTLPRVVNTLNALAAGGIKVAGVVIDGVDLKQVSAEDLQTGSSYAKATNVKVWMAATAEGNKIEDCVPATLEPLFDAVLNLEQNGSINLNILKLRDKKNIKSTMKLDSKSLLILEK